MGSGISYINESVSSVLSLGHLPLHRGQLLLGLVGVVLLRGLIPAQLLLLDPVLTIYLTQEGRVHLGAGELTQELPASVPERQGRLHPQGLVAD